MSEPLKRGEVAVQEWIWEKDVDPPFHRVTYSEFLEKFHDKLFGKGETGRVFVPLCGKTLDMIFLADHGHEVVGLEFSEVGVEAFFKENNLTYVKTAMESVPFVQYKTNEKNITIFRGDLFDLKPEICGKFDATLDRGSYVAINVPTQETYVSLMHALLKPGGRILAETYMYDPSKFAGPPHSITNENLQNIFGKNFTVQELEMVCNPAPVHFKVDMDFHRRVSFLTAK